MLLPIPRVCHGPCTASHCWAVSIATPAAMCHFQGSSHCWCVLNFLT
ncbi:unnamed protein product [Staurois parvus]|uniref:Uncharacterized protein n=1 Tax=Staurois parvus TaxID=386267 RepID=A0ABN9B5N4_9NEOB|nr:unnamed protein product [Staurois parvus]